jgi:glycosyltransferase involved in cell wall biosynthesis
MRIAFYAPLKPPDHPVASGDRQIARTLVHALVAGGHDVSLASRLRSFDGGGDRARQARLAAIAARIAQRLIARMRARPPDLWFTYHLHHKAPDLLGPIASRALAIPYVVAEASTAPGQRDGPWAEGHASALAAIRAADLVLCLNPRDEAEVRKARAIDAALESLAPFIDVSAFAGDAPRARADQASPGGRVRLVTIGMMREGAKLASYRSLAAALVRLADLPWELSIVGDGVARAEVVAAFAGLAQRVRFLGARPGADVASVLRESDLFVWPAIDEAIGIAFLEAQACGLPVVGADTPGVASVVAHARTGLLVPHGDIAAFAAATRTLLLDAPLRERMGVDAFAYVRERHDLPRAAARLDAMLRSVTTRHVAHAPARTAAAPC